MSAVLNLPSYQVFVGEPWGALNGLIEEQNPSRLIVLVDQNTESACLPILQKALAGRYFDAIVIPPGEQHKNIDTCQHIWKKMMALGADRRAMMINLGGGVIGDMGGFCASTFKRGIPFVQVPTTLLSQVDASVGSKLGIDFAGVKNSIGLFNDPKGVFIDPIFFDTLPVRELRSGFAEVIKHALIADAGQWDVIRKIEDLRSANWPAILLPSLRVKQRIVAEDPFEKGIRKALNFGHTIGHAIESVALESSHSLLHGEAIAIGMVAEAWLSWQKGALSKEQLRVITDFLIGKYNKEPINPADYPAYHHLARNDKKNENGKILFSLIGPIGQAKVNQVIQENEIERALDYYLEYRTIDQTN